MKVQAAAISVHGNQLVVALVGLELVQKSGEADLAIGTLEPAFGGAPVVLMAQREDGTPVYYGDQALVSSLEGLPVEEMPWKEYSVAG